jgi:hypothetical protein
MTLHLTAEQRDIVAQAKAITKGSQSERNRALRAERKERRKQLAESAAPNKRDPRQHDAGFLAWLHEDLPCIGCLIEGPGPVGYSSIEAAHQKVAIASKGWSKGGLGPRVSDHRACPLCVWHHRLAGNSCDTGGQRKFWDRLGLGDEVADFCAELFHAYRNHEDGVAVVRSWAAAGLAGVETSISRASGRGER